jgi:acetyl-CoA carboxylase biotin carboxyl carrier protein
MNEEVIIKLMEKFSAANIAELDIQEGALHIVLRKDEAVRAAVSVAPVQAGALPVVSPATVMVPAAGGQVSGDAVRLGLPGAAIAGNVPAGEAITSPIVATYYAAAGPDAPAFVKTGSRVKAGDTLCILEAMKMMNHLEAEFDCEILAIKAASGDLVEYGQVLFEVKRL